MLNIKTTMKGALLSAALIFSNEALCAENFNKDSQTEMEKRVSSEKMEPNFSELEKEFPMFFAGFNATPFALIEHFRLLNENERLQPVAGIREAMESLSKQLEAIPQFLHIKADLDKRLLISGNISVIEYGYYLLRIAVSQGVGTDDEEAFFKGAGFSLPYASLDQGDFAVKLSQTGLSSFQDFVSLFEKVDFLTHHDDRGDFSHNTFRHYFDDEDTVEKAVQKGPFARTPWPLPGKDILGLFYLAFTYAKGIHPIPIPFSDQPCSLHGIKMSRWAQICHDLAHSKGDAANYNAEQFANHLANHFADMLDAGKGDELEQDQVERYSIPEMLPHFTAFSMAVHNLYRQSLVDILMLSLAEMDPRDKERLPDFKAFCAAAFLQGHERPIDISRKYGTHNLVDLLILGTPQDPGNPVKEETQNNMDDVNKSPDYVDQEFGTSFITGETILTDKQIFDLVKMKPRSEFINCYPVIFNGGVILKEKEIARYKVGRNKFYLEVEIALRTGEKLLFRKGTNYSSQLNFDHDSSILIAARPVLKREYNYDLPKIPAVPDLSNDDAIKAYEKEALECRLALEQGFNHLLDMWAKYSRNLSHKTPTPFTLSIAERFEIEYKVAYQQLVPLMPAFSGNLEDFIRDAVKIPGQVPVGDITVVSSSNM